ncbi:hypothetical protein [Spiroplasma endosymbiont of Apeira syringaria]|uniref:hypothetical protein n=1 Tax=Spiroplasma endosymbiont of Apeira syringaria TaxID=3066307 RepID=UPI0030CFC031
MNKEKFVKYLNNEIKVLTGKSDIYKICHDTNKILLYMQEMKIKILEGEFDYESR